MYKIILQNPDKNIYCVHLDTKNNVTALADILDEQPEIEVLELRILHKVNQSNITLQMRENFTEQHLATLLTLINFCI
jgi:hypothetical protein